MKLKFLLVSAVILALSILATSRTFAAGVGNQSANQNINQNANQQNSATHQGPSQKPAASQGSSSNAPLQTVAVSRLISAEPASGFSYVQNRFSPQTTAILYTTAAVLASVGFALATAYQKRLPLTSSELRTDAVGDSLTITN